MDISKWFIRSYLDHVTVCWFNRHDYPPKRVEEYLPYVLELQKAATSRGDLSALKVALEYILGNSQIDSSDLGNGRWDYDDAEVRDIVRLAWKTIWPDAQQILPGGPSDVRLVGTLLPITGQLSE